jgi:hypothetical protein
VQENQWLNAKIPDAYEKGVYFTEQGGVFWLEGTYLDFRRLARRTNPAKGDKRSIFDCLDRRKAPIGAGGKNATGIF